MDGFFFPTGFRPVTLTLQSALTTHSITDCPTPRGHLLRSVVKRGWLHFFIYFFLLEGAVCCFETNTTKGNVACFLSCGKLC
jgi:hypothetical protein